MEIKIFVIQICFVKENVNLSVLRISVPNVFYFDEEKKNHLI